MQRNMYSHSYRTAARTVTSTLPFAPAHPEAARANARPVLKLVHGSSDDAQSFAHRARMPGAISTVGASLGCDWTVRAAGVPSVAFALRQDGGSLSICPAPEAHVFVDGRRELPVWRSLRIGSRVDVGLLRIEVVSDVLGDSPSGPVPTARVRPQVVPGERDTTSADAVAASILGAEQEAQSRAAGAADEEPSLPMRFPWALMAALSASAALYVLTLSVLD